MPGAQTSWTVRKAGAGLALVAVSAAGGILGMGPDARSQEAPLAAGQAAVFADDEAAIERLVERAKAAPNGVAVEELARTEGASVHRIAIVGEVEPHRHLAHDEVVRVVRGAGTFIYGDFGEKTVAAEVKAGWTVAIPRGTAHAYRPAKEAGPTVAVLVYSPPFDGKDRVPLEGPGGK